MKYIILSILVLFSVSAYSQIEDTPLFVGKYFGNQSGGNSTHWRVTGTFTDEAMYYDATGIQVGDILFFVDAGIGYHLPIDTIVSASGSDFTVSVSKSGITGVSAVPNGPGGIYRANSPKGLWPDPAGLTAADRQTLNSFLIKRLNQEPVKRDTFITVPHSTNYIPNLVITTPARFYNNIYLSCKGISDTSTVAFLAAPTSDHYGVVYNIKNDSGLVETRVLSDAHFSNTKTSYLLRPGQMAQVRALRDQRQAGAYKWAVNLLWDSTVVSGGGQASIQFKDEGSNLGTTGTVTDVNVTGSGATASRSGNAITINIPGGGSTESVINIANYSPTANGIANDSTAFAQAIAAAVAAGYKKIFLNGKNYYARGINNPYGVEFFGGGLVRFGVDSIAYITKDKTDRLSFGQEYLSAWQKKVIANANDTIRVVYSGDSTTEGGEFVAKTTQYLTDLTGLVFKSWNRGYSAQTTTHWDTLYLKQDTAAIPNMDLYVVRWGINDGFFNLGLASFQTHLRSGLAKLRAWKNSTKLGIVLMTPNATSYSGTKSNEAWHDQINAIIRQAARDYQCFFFDTYSLMKDANSSRGLQTWLDNVETHPNTYAQRLIAGELAKAIVPQYLVRVPGIDFRSALQANTLPLTTTPDAFVNGVTFRLNTNSAGSWPTDGIVITYKSPNAALQYLFPSTAGQAGSKPWTRYGNSSVWSAWDQRPYTQISGAVTVVAGNAAPSTYVYDASHARITDSLNGSLMNFRSIDNITLQLAHSYLTDDLFYRNGFSGSWVGAGFRRVLSLSRASGIAFFSGVATNPNSIQTANVGSLYFCTANGNLWSKATGTGNTGWVQHVFDEAARVFLESSTATTIDLDAGTTVKDRDGNNTTFTFPSNLSKLRVFKNGILLSETGSLTTRDYSVNTGTNAITFSVALISTDRVIIEK